MLGRVRPSLYNHCPMRSYKKSIWDTLQTQCTDIVNYILEDMGLTDASQLMSVVSSPDHHLAMISPKSAPPKASLGKRLVRAC